MKKSNPPIFSIIIPCYNVANYITETINSILEQSFKNYEVILIDDGSKDNTVKIISELIRSLNNFKLIKKSNKGVSSARNLGITYSKANYLLFLDSDDLIKKDLLSSVYFELENNNVDIISFGFEKFGLNKKEYLYKNNKSKYSFTAEEYLCLVFHKKIYQHICSMVIKKELISNNNIIFNEDISYSEDFLFFCMLITKANKIIYIPQIYFSYRIRKNSAMTSVSNYKRLDSLYALDLLSSYLQKNNINYKVYQSFIEYKNITRLYLIKLLLRNKKNINLIKMTIKYNIEPIPIKHIFSSKKIVFIISNIISYVLYILRKII